MASEKKRTSMKVIPEGKSKCVWMEAGVVSYKLCDHNFDCVTCTYDHGLQAGIEKQRLNAGAPAGKISESWKEVMLKLPATLRKCRYMMTGEIGRKLCPSAYDCATCSFDQMMQERLQVEPLQVQLPTQEHGFDIVDDFYYHEGHTWARMEYGGRVRVGLDDFAGKLLGKGCSVQLPGIGAELTQGTPGFSVRRKEHTADILSPIDGIVTDVNNMLNEDPSLLSESCYEKGWLFTIEPGKLKKNLKTLYYGEEARTFIREESEALFARVNEDFNVMADGGGPVEDIFADLKDEDWSKIVKIFLRS